MSASRCVITKRDLLKLIWKCGIILFFIILVGYSALVTVYKIPTDKIEQNVEKSTYTFTREGSYYSPAGSVVDNYTDALMLLTAAYSYEENVFLAALNNSRYDIPGTDPTGSLLRIYLEPEAEKTSVNYSRYWHGYLVFLKPLLFFMDFKSIRYTSTVIQLALILFITILLTKQNKERFVIPLFCCWIFINPTAVGLSMQLNTVWSITLIFLLIVVRYYNVWNLNRWFLVFFIFGGLISFFDLLTYPILGLCLLLLCLYNLLEISNIQDSSLLITGCSVFWFLGYIGLWSSKWFLSSILLKRNVIGEALSQIIFRSSGRNEMNLISSIYTVFINNFNVLDSPSIYMLSLVIVFITIFLVITKKILLNKQIIFMNFIISLFPVVWYCVVRNHSAEHAWMTYRLIAVFYVSYCMCIISGLKVKNN